MPAGEAMRRREAGARALASGRNRGLTQRILRATLRRKAGEAFISEDIRRRLIGKGDPCPNAWGTAFHNAARAGHIVADGFRRATRPESHARVLVVWRRA